MFDYKLFKTKEKAKEFAKGLTNNYELVFCYGRSETGLLYYQEMQQRDLMDIAEEFNYIVIWHK